MMNLKITQKVLKSFRDKASKEPETVALYKNHDYITAYGLHTDKRVEKDPIWAIGRGDEWESHGDLQRDFLIALGLQPEHALLDIGCGVGRAARKFVPYLNEGNYTGCDISRKALAHAMGLSESEGWAEKKPAFVFNADLDFDREFDFLWAHSVFTHSPEQQIEKMIKNAFGITRIAFAFTYKRAEKPQRSGLKQFQYPESFFIEVGERCGWKAKGYDLRWPAGQRTVLLTK